MHDPYSVFIIVMLYEMLISSDHFRIMWNHTTVFCYTPLWAIKQITKSMGLENRLPLLLILSSELMIMPTSQSSVHHTPAGCKEISHIGTHQYTCIWYQEIYSMIYVGHFSRYAKVIHTKFSCYGAVYIAFKLNEVFKDVASIVGMLYLIQKKVCKYI